MGNYFLDNEDIQFALDTLNIKELAELQEMFAENGDADYAPETVDDAVTGYAEILKIVGSIAADTIAPAAEQVDNEGHTLNEDGTVTLNPLTQKNLDKLAQGNMLGFTLPRRYGGLNCPNLIYTMATEIVSRADCSFMNMFGLQGIAETINAFASQEIKDMSLSRFCTGEVTGAMVLTEPDAGSDLQAVRLKAELTEDGKWVLNGVKRFITNGCGEILLVLARSEPEITDGRGLSLFYVESDETVKVRHLEEKLGIHGSPTCELTFTNTPALLIGERQRGLITYVMALMNGARVGIAAQSLGVAEAAFRLARTYAAAREQFGAPIEVLPPVAEMLVDMKVKIEASRALTYHTCTVCDKQNNGERLSQTPGIPKEIVSEQRKAARNAKRINGMLTPMSKYYGSEMAIEVSNMGLQVLGGSGYIKDYAAERYVRDARITNIYEGTSQLQVVAVIKGITSGTFESYIVDTFESKTYDDADLETLKASLIESRKKTVEAINFVKEQGTGYIDLSARKLVDCAIDILIGHLFLAQAEKCDRKKKIAKYFIERQAPRIAANVAVLLNRNSQAIDDYKTIVGDVPAAE